MPVEVMKKEGDYAILLYIGEEALSSETISGSTSETRWMSSSVVHLPIVKRIEP